MIRACIFFCFVLICSYSYGQNSTQLHTKALKAMEQGDYSEAIDLFEEIIDTRENLYHIYEKIAECYMLNLQYNESIDWYMKALKNQSNCTTCMYYSAKLYHMLGQSQKAAMYYQLFLNSKQTDSTKREIARHSIASIHSTDVSTSDQTIHTFTHHPFIHSYTIVKYNDSYVISGIEFISDMKTNTNFFVYPPDSTFDYPLLLNNAEYTITDFAPIYNSDSALITVRKSLHPNEIPAVHFIQKHTKNIKSTHLAWQEINVAQHKSIQPHMSYMHDKKILFFASNRPGGYGGMDIWYAYINENGSLGDVINAGKTINTTADEICPFFHAESNTLYFSSELHNSLGGFDIFSSKLLDTIWSTPENVGIPINSSYNDLYYKIFDTCAMFSSNRDITYNNNKPFFYNKVYYYSTNQPQIVDNSAINATSPPSVPTAIHVYFAHNSPQNSATLYSTCFNDYKNTFLPEPDSSNFSLALVVERRKKQGFFSDYVERNYHDFIDLIDTVSRRLQANGEVQITLQGFTSYSGSVEYNEKVALHRVASVKNEIVMQLSKTVEQNLISNVQFVIIEPQIANTTQGVDVFEEEKNRKVRIEIIH